MSNRRLLWCLPIAALAITGCQHAEVGCGCATYALEVSASDGSGTSIALDSLHYLWGTDTLRKTPLANESNLSIGTREGLYRLIAFHGSQFSDTVDVEVRYGGPKECRTLSTQVIQFTFPDTSKPTFLTRKIGGCGDH
jgi:hypothetical protein